MKEFITKLDEMQISHNSLVCVGLDSEFGKIPKHAYRKGNECNVDLTNTMVHFNASIMEAVHGIVAACKLNLAFYLEHGSEGINALSRTITDIRVLDRDLPIILDGKFGDVENTDSRYAEFAFKFLRVDAITINPYLGREANQPVLDYADKGIFVLCRTSNKGAGEFQDKLVPVPGNGRHVPLYQDVAHSVASEWNANHNCGLVVGATYPGELALVRQIIDDSTEAHESMPILSPGVGKQGGDVEKTVKAGIDSRKRGLLINSSSGIIFASPDANYVEAARTATLKLRDESNQYR